MQYKHACFKKTQWNNSDNFGLLREIAADRKCGDLSYAIHGTSSMCICSAEVKEATANETEQFLKDVNQHMNKRIPQSAKHKCRKLDLRSVNQRTLRKHLHGKNRVEILANLELSDGFKDVAFSVRARLTDDGSYQVKTFSRLDSYGRFFHCAPKGVDIMLCACE